MDRYVESIHQIDCTAHGVEQRCSLQRIYGQTVSVGSVLMFFCYRNRGITEPGMNYVGITRQLKVVAG